MRYALAAALLVSAAHSTPAMAWGAIGHRITGAIAQDNLSGVARANVEILLGNEDLAEAATWPDDMRSDPSEFWQKTASPWHYVTVAGDDYQASDEPKEGDADAALKRFTATLRDSKASADDKRLALRFIVHIIGDLHQPLHAGGGTDRGGNDVKVTWFGKPTNLHTVWDSSMIEQRQLSYSEYAHWLERATTPEEVVTWSVRDLQVWMHESIALRKTIYPANPALSYDYAYQHRGEIDQRLKMAGVRIAAYLNWVFETPDDGGKTAKRR
ncbi:S1/P1 Nuclease [Novosphingobium barchaimii LL02]|uniref:S1/P1 Nuclease n=1 Tax=Novosphingobium barchaimii LL02 TaxID=1114963 RepID=A0A0J7XXE3_9SPHN|nr:S1/P1 nuclease [Novosphingobium barchaimii]KMS56199.1 S1/P1 Nuclease [Novosphingobium barchaimii LL02]